MTSFGAARDVVAYAFRDDCDLDGWNANAALVPNPVSEDDVDFEDDRIHGRMLASARVSRRTRGPVFGAQELRRAGRDEQVDLEGPFM